MEKINDKTKEIVKAIFAAMEEEVMATATTDSNLYTTTIPFEIEQSTTRNNLNSKQDTTIPNVFEASTLRDNLDLESITSIPIDVIETTFKALSDSKPLIKIGKRKSVENKPEYVYEINEEILSEDLAKEAKSIILTALSNSFKDCTGGEVTIEEVSINNNDLDVDISQVVNINNQGLENEISETELEEDKQVFEDIFEKISDLFEKSTTSAEDIINDKNKNEVFTETVSLKDSVDLPNFTTETNIAVDETTSDVPIETSTNDNGLELDTSTDSDDLSIDTSAANVVGIEETGFGFETPERENEFIDSIIQKVWVVSNYTFDSITTL